MDTVRDVLKKTKKLDAKCTERTLWHYYKLRLLPEAQKISGRGNVVFFPRDTAVRIWLISFLTTQLGFTLSEICRYPWAQFDMGEALSTFDGLPKDFVFGAKQKLLKSREDSLKHTMEAIRAVIGAVDNDANVSVEKIKGTQFGNGLPEAQHRKPTGDFQPEQYVRKLRAHLAPDANDDMEGTPLGAKDSLRSSLRKPRT